MLPNADSSIKYNRWRKWVHLQRQPWEDHDRGNTKPIKKYHHLVQENSWYWVLPQRRLQLLPMGQYVGKCWRREYKFLRRCHQWNHRCHSIQQYGVGRVSDRIPKIFNYPQIPRVNFWVASVSENYRRDWTEKCIDREILIGDRRDSILSFDQDGTSRTFWWKRKTKNVSW